MSEEMMDIVKKQVEIGETIAKLHENYKKEGKRLKKKERLTEWQTILNERWDEFTTNHAVLDGYNDEWKNNQMYFKDNYYGRIRLIYNAMLSDIQLKGSFIEEVDVIIDSDENKQKDMGELFASDLNNTVMRSKASTPLPHMEETLTDEQQYIVRRFMSKLKTISNMLQKIEKIMKEGTRARATTMMETVHELKQQITDGLDDVCILFEGKDDAYRNMFECIHEKYCEITENLKIKENKPAEPVTLKLKPIQIPTFAGSYKLWPTFSGLFKSLIIQNNSLMNIQKMHYLKTNVTGDAAKIIAQLEITDDNFETAWDMLCQRYENKRAIVNAHFETFFNIKSVTNTTTSIELRNILNIVRECASLLKDTPIEQALLFYALKQLDKSSIERYEIAVQDSKEIQKLNNFLSFLEKRCEIIDKIAIQNDSHNFKNIKQNSQTGKCPCCPNRHPLYLCETFKKMKINERSDLVKKQKLCRVCLKQNHLASECTFSKNCSECNGRHSNFLHFSNERKNDEKQIDKQKIENKKSYAAVIMNTDNEEKQEKKDVIACVATNDNSAGVLLATALVRIKTSSGWSEPLRALIDQGSTASFISESVVRDLNLNRIKNDLCVTGIGGTVAEPSKGSVILDLTARYPTATGITTTAIIMNKLISVLPGINCDEKIIDHNEFRSLVLADPTLYVNGKVDIILGVEVL